MGEEALSEHRRAVRLQVTAQREAHFILQGIARLAREQGLTVGFPSLVDPDWSLAHAAFLHAHRAGDGRRLMLALFRKRFVEGRDLGEDEAIADAARDAGLDPADIVAAAHDHALRDEVAAGWKDGAERDGIFGVPSFVYAGKLYWGQDRMHFVRSAVLQKRA